MSGKAALLESKDAVIKLGAGNIFTGDFALDGTNGVLQLGRPFTSFPTSLKFQYKYTSTTINRIGQDVGSLENLRGRPDSCQIYIALSDKPEPYEIRTKPSVRQVFDKTTVISSPMASSSADSLPRAISRLRYPWNIVRRIVRPNISSSWRRLASTVITSSGGKAVPFG